MQVEILNFGKKEQGRMKINQDSQSITVKYYIASSSFNSDSANAGSQSRKSNYFASN
jgi:hypothetical protein